MKIGIKLVSIISIFNVIGIGLLVGFTLTSSQKEISRLADEQAYSLAAQGAEEIKNWFGAYVETQRGLVNIMEGYKDIPIEERRKYFNFMLKQILIAHPEISNIYSNWGPNALDGMDMEYANTPGTDESGRYITSWASGPQGPLLGAIPPNFTFDAVMQMTSGEEFIFDPAVEPIGGKNLLGTSICIPVKDLGKMVGSIGIAFELSRIQTITDTIKPFGDGYAMIFSNGGLVAAHPNSEYLGKNMVDIDTFGSSLPTAQNAITGGKTMAFSLPSPQGLIQYYAVPFTIGRYPKPWTLMVAVPRRTIMAPVYRMLTFSIIIGVFTMILMSVGSVFIARSVSRPIAYTMGTLKYIAEGDLTKQVEVNSNDELGDLARYLNWTVERIKTLVFAIKRETDMLSSTGTELAAHATETAAAITEITAHIQSIKTQVLNQSASVSQSGAIMHQLVDQIATLGELIEKQVAAGAKSSSSIDGMLANIQRVTQSMIGNVNNIISLSESSEVGRGGLQEVSTNIQEIAHESEGLLEINAVMENIASQTNLLSMNAAIEAAHAGEAGKGFAVVAGEIRKLAESSSEQSRTIGAVLKKIKDSIDKITKSTEGVLRKFEVIEEGIQMVTDQEKAVRDAMEEQGASSNSILEAVKLLNEMTDMVKSCCGEMLMGSQEVIGESRSLSRMTEEIAGGVREIATGAEQINGSMTRVAGITTDTQDRIHALIHEVSKFKTA
jgi:methyl-accepting chemotaxis protein